MKRRMGMTVVFAFVACMMIALSGCSESYDPSASLKSSTVDASALKEAGTLHVGVDASTYPLAGQSNGNMSGMNVDIAAAIAEELGLKVDFVDVGTDGAKAVSDGEVDIAMGIESGSSSSCWTSKSYAPSCIVLFSLDEGAGLPKKSDSLKIATQTSSLAAYLVKQQYESGAVVTEDDLKTVFQDLTDGKVSYVGADAIVGSYMLNKLGIDAHIVGTLQDPAGYCIGVASKNDTLQSAVKQALETIQGNGVFDTIMKRWTGAPVDLDGVPSVTSSSSKSSSTSSEDAAAAVAENAGDSDIQVGSNAITTTTSN